MVLASGGLPLWDGVTDIEVRPARTDEEAKWRASRAKAIRRGNVEENDVGWIAFLVALTDRRNGDRAGLRGSPFDGRAPPSPDLGRVLRSAHVLMSAHGGAPLSGANPKPCAHAEPYRF
jgi:hypothetical protein